MDELAAVARLRDGMPDPTPETLAGARARLDRRMNSTVPRSATVARPRRRSLRPALIGVAAAAAVAVGTGVLVVGGGSTGSTPVAGAGSGAPRHVGRAATLLDLAADHTTSAGDPVVRTGQYTHVTTDSWIGEDVGGVSFLQKQRMEVWVPAKGAGTWHWRETDGLGTRFANDADRRATRAHHPDVFTKKVYLSSGHDGRQDAAPAGEPQPAGGGEPDWDFPTPAWLAGQPRDPKALLAAIEAAQPTPAPGTKAKGDLPTLTFFQIAQTLSTGIAPADLRAALYRAAKSIPGIQVVSSATTINGRKGIAIGRAEPLGYLRQEIVFDAAAGRFLGEREVVVRSVAADAHLPVGSTYRSTAVAVTVTGTAPTFH